MKKTILLIFTLLAAVLPSHSASDMDYSKKEAARVSCEKLREMLKVKDFLLVDVNIPEQKHLQKTDQYYPVELIDVKMSGYTDKDKMVVLYCKDGVQSRKAASELNSLGFKNVLVLEGGTDEWKKRGYDYNGPDQIVYITALKAVFTPKDIKVIKGNSVMLIAETLDEECGFSLVDFGLVGLVQPGKQTVFNFIASIEGEHEFCTNIPCRIKNYEKKGKVIVLNLKEY